MFSVNYPLADQQCHSYTLHCPCFLNLRWPVQLLSSLQCPLFLESPAACEEIQMPRIKLEIKESAWDVWYCEDDSLRWISLTLFCWWHIFAVLHFWLTCRCLFHNSQHVTPIKVVGIAYQPRGSGVGAISEQLTAKNPQSHLFYNNNNKPYLSLIIKLIFTRIL